MAAEPTSIGLPEKKAVALAAAVTIKLPKRTPYNVAMDLLSNGRWIEKNETRECGLMAGALYPRPPHLCPPKPLRLATLVTNLATFYFSYHPAGFLRYSIEIPPDIRLTIHHATKSRSWRRLNCLSLRRVL
jgi:hypothetical protein